MSAGGLMSLGIRAMFASQAALQSTGHNISNANVDGYSRQKTVLATAQGQFTGAGYFGKGVNVVSVQREYNEFLSREAVGTSSMAAYDTARQTQLKRIENVFPTGEQGVGFAVNRFLNSMADLASKPQDNSARQVVLSEARNVAGRFASAADQLSDIQQGINSDLGVAITAVNGLAKQLGDVNDQIARVNGQGQPPNDLLDQRDRLVSELSQYLQVTTQPVKDGTISVFIGGGQPLVMGAHHQELAQVRDTHDSSLSRVAFKDSGALLDTNSLSGGSIAGMLNIQDGDLRDAGNQLGRLAAAVAGAVNDQQSYGMDLQGLQGSALSKVFDVGAPTLQPAKGNAAASNAAVSVSLAQWGALQPNDYRLEVDPAGNYHVLRQTSGGAPGDYDKEFVLSATGQVTGWSSPPGGPYTASTDGLVDGVQINIGPGGFAPGESFVLRPVGRAAAGMAMVMTSPAQIAAGAPLVSQAASTNSGQAVASKLEIQRPDSAVLQDATVNFIDGSGNWELRDSGGTVLGSGQWTAGSPVVAAAGIRLTLAGTPAANDTFTLKPNTAVAGDNGNALGLLALRDQKLVDGMTFTDTYAAALADVGVRVRSGDAAVQTSTQLASSAQEALKSKTGVNVDEEAAQLMKFQQSYQAAAKILQVAQQVFQTLLDSAGH